MAEFSYPFDAGSGAIVTEDDWSDMAKNWQDDGVVSDSLSPLALEVETLVELNTVYVNPGMAVIQGFMYRNTTALPLVFTTNGSGNPRMDRVVLRLDRSTNVIQAVVKEGTPAASPVAPDVDTVYPVYEISLGYYTVAAGASTTLVAIQDRPYTSRRIRISDTTLGQPIGSIVYSPTNDTFHMVKAGSAVEIGSGGGSGNSILLMKSADQEVTGTIGVADTHLSILPPVDDVRYLIEGTIYYWCDTPAAALTFSINGSPTSPPTAKVRYEHVTSASATTVTTTASGSLPSVSIGAVASSTFYSINFQASGNFLATDPEFDIIEVVYQPATGAPVWTISGNSWMRLTQVT